MGLLLVCVFFLACWAFAFLSLCGFCYFQLETGCDSDSMADYEIEWTNHTDTCADTHTHTRTDKHLLCQRAHRIKASCSLSTPTQRGFLGTLQGSPCLLRHPKVSKSEQRWSICGSSRTLLSFNIILKHQVLTRPSLRSEK